MNQSQCSTRILCCDWLIVISPQHVICPREYKRLVEEISATLKQAVEMVQVVLNNEKLRYGDRIHVGYKIQ